MLYNTIMKMRQLKGIEYCCEYSIAFCTKYRRRVLSDQMRTALAGSIEASCTDLGVDLLDADIGDNLVKLKISAEPGIGVHRAVKRIKADSSRALRNAYPELRTKVPTLWDNNYLVVAGADIPDDVLIGYVKRQITSQRQKG